jgi:hypothetical protein
MGKTFETLSGTAWQGYGMSSAWARHAMCESAFREQYVPVSLGPPQSRIPRPEIEIWPPLCEAGD